MHFPREELINHWNKLSRVRIESSLLKDCRSYLSNSGKSALVYTKVYIYKGSMPK